MVNFFLNSSLLKAVLPVKINSVTIIVSSIFNSSSGEVVGAGSNSSGEGGEEGAVSGKEGGVGGGFISCGKS